MAIAARPGGRPPLELETAHATGCCARSFKCDAPANGLADVTSSVITFTVDKARTLTPIYSRDWLVYQYDKANEGGSGTEWRLKDGNFDIAVKNCDLVGGAVEYYSSVGTWLKAGHGAIDLSTKKVHYLTGQQVAIKRIGLKTLKEGSVQRSDFSRVVLPRELEMIQGGSFRDQTNISEVVMDCPNLTNMTGDVFTRCTGIRRLVLKVPALEEINGNYAFFNAILDDTDACDWDLSGLRKLSGGSSRFNLAEMGMTHGFKGTLSLPRAESIGESDFTTQTAFTNLVLGSEKGRLSYIGPNAFYNCANMKSVTIGCTKDLTVGQNAFGGSSVTSRIKEFWFLRHIPSQAALDTLLARNTANSWDRALLYVSPNRSMWSGFLTPLDRSTSALDKDAPSNAIGAYVTAAGERKAWICYRASPLDRGIMLIFR